MKDLFSRMENFNGDITRWEVSKVTDMDHMLHSALAFNQPMGSWGVSRMSSLMGMSGEARSFSAPLLGSGASPIGG